MADNDVIFKDQNAVPLSFNPRTKDIGAGVRESIIGIADTANTQVDPMPKTGGTVTAKAQDGAGNNLTSKTAGAERSLTVAVVDGSGNQITAFGGAGGTASNFGSADPVAGTAIGFSDGTNMREARVFDADSGGGTQFVVGVGLRKTASGGSVEAGTSTDPLRTDPTGTTTQPISGTIALGAGAAAIGSIIGRTTMTVVTPAVTLAAYTAGLEIGGLMTFAVGGAGTGGTLMSVRVTSKAVQTTALTAFIFTTNPSNSTWADRTAPAINAADVASLLCAVPLTSAYSGLGTHTVWNVGNIGAQFLGASLYVVLVTVSATSLNSTSDITVSLGLKVD